MKKYIFVIFTLIFIFMMNMQNIHAKEVLKECDYLCSSSDCTKGYGGKVVFYDDKTSKVFISDNSVPSGSAKLKNAKAANEQFAIDSKCPSYFVRYSHNFGLGPKFYVMYNETDLKEWIKKENSMITIKWAPLVNKDEEDGITENGEIITYKKTYTSKSTNNLGVLQFNIKYNNKNQYYSGTTVTIGAESVSLVYKSVADFTVDILDPIRNLDRWPELYCGKISSYLTLKDSAFLITGVNTNNGTVVCSPDKNLFNDGTNKLARYQLPKVLTENPVDEDEEDIDNDESILDEEDMPEIHYPDYNVDDTATIENTCSNPSFRKPMKFIGVIINFIRIIIPILIIGFGILDLYKAITANKDDGLKKAVKSIMIRAIAGVFIFLLPGIIQFVLNMVNEWSDYKNAWCCCTDCLLNPDCDVNSCSSDNCHIEGTNK